MDSFSIGKSCISIHKSGACLIDTVEKEILFFSKIWAAKSKLQKATFAFISINFILDGKEEICSSSSANVNKNEEHFTFEFPIFLIISEIFISVEISEIEMSVLRRKQVDLVQSILNTQVPVRFTLASGERQVVLIHVQSYLQRLVHKLWPVLLTGGVRLTGSCASQVALGQRSRRISDVDICFLVSEEVDFNQVLFHEQQILKKLGKQKEESTVAELLDTVRVSNETDCWTLFSFGSTGPTGKHLDIRVAKSMSRSYVFSCDSLEVVIDPLVVKGMEREQMMIFSRWGDYSVALHDLKTKRLVMPSPASVRHGLIRYCLALCKGFKIDNEKERQSLEQVLVSIFLTEFKSPEQTKTFLQRTAERHTDGIEQAELKNQMSQVISRNIQDIL